MKINRSILASGKTLGAALMMLPTAYFMPGVSQAEVPLITNGDFEISVPTNDTGGGWTSSNIDGSNAWTATGGNPGGAFVLNATGDNWGGAGKDPTIEQTVTGLTSGALYRLTGDYAVYHVGWTCYYHPNGKFGIDVNGVNIAKLPPAACDNTAVTWGDFSVDFIAPAADVPIAFRAEIDGSDTDYAIDNIALTFIGFVPEITVTDTLAPTDDLQIPFGDVAEGNSHSRFITLKNDGSADLVLGVIAYTDPLDPPFSLSDPCSGQTLAAGASCTITVAFAPYTPYALGPFSDTFNIPSNDSDEPNITFSVTGTGIPAPVPDISITDGLGDSYDLQLPFADTTVGQSQSATVTLINTGNADLSVTSMQLTGAGAGHFALDTNPPDDPCGSTPGLSAGADCNVTVTFSPASVGTKTATLEINSNDPDHATVAVALSGMGLSAMSNNAPSTPALVYPVNGQQDVLGTVVFEWQPATDPDGDSVTYDIHYCTDPDPLNNCQAVEVPTGTNGSHGLAFAALVPGSGLLVLGMIAAAPAGRRRLWLQVAAALVAGLLLASCSSSGNNNNSSNITYTATGLTAGATYYWVVVARDGQGGETPSDVWSFTTRAGN